jgi:hypothetical protein
MIRLYICILLVAAAVCSNLPIRLGPASMLGPITPPSYSEILENKLEETAQMAVTTINKKTNGNTTYELSRVLYENARIGDGVYLLR